MSDFTGFRPQWGISVTPEYKTLRSDTDAGGLGVRRQKWQNPRYRLRFRSVHLGANALTEAQAVQALFTSCKGGRSTFTLTVDSVQYTCVFAGDQFPSTLAAFRRYEFDVDLVGVTS